jgi:hypothetical protein
MVGFGFHFFSQKPGTGSPNLCSNIYTEVVDRDQEKFVVQDFKNGKTFTIGIPCKVYK